MPHRDALLHIGRVQDCSLPSKLPAASDAPIRQHRFGFETHAVERRTHLVRRHTKNLPSSPSESASCVLKNPPSGAVILAHDVIKRVLGDLKQKRVAGHLPSVEVDPRPAAHCLQHLFEVRDQPDFVPLVAMEAAAQLIVHPTLCAIALR